MSAVSFDTGNSFLIRLDSWWGKNRKCNENLKENLVNFIGTEKKIYWKFKSKIYSQI